MPYVYSTGTCAGTYVEHAPAAKNDGFSTIVRQVTINGGHGVANKHLVTPKGAVTKVSDEELEFLLKNDAFQRHIKAGFITYDKKEVDPAKRAAEMAKGDNSAPLTPSDFKEGENSTQDARIYTGKPKK